MEHDSIASKQASERKAMAFFQIPLIFPREARSRKFKFDWPNGSNTNGKNYAATALNFMLQQH